MNLDVHCDRGARKDILQFDNLKYFSLPPSSQFFISRRDWETPASTEWKHCSAQSKIYVFDWICEASEPAKSKSSLNTQEPSNSEWFKTAKWWLSYELWLQFTWQQNLAPGSQTASLRDFKIKFQTGLMSQLSQIQDSGGLAAGRAHRLHMAWPSTTATHN